ncbi:hypothetical protein [Bacillus sp. P14.5]|nr:hypothetical protein [Bacillus sp. P14.5]
MFLRQNGYKLMVSPQEAEDFTVLMVEKKNPSIPFDDIVGWIEDNSILSS